MKNKLPIIFIQVLLMILCYSCGRTYVVPEELTQTAVITDETISVRDITLTFNQSLGTVTNFPDGFRPSRDRESDLYFPGYDCVIGVRSYNEDLKSTNPKDNIFSRFKLFFLNTGYSFKGRDPIPTQYKSAQFPDFEIIYDMILADVCLQLNKAGLEYEMNRDFFFNSPSWIGAVIVEDYNGLKLSFNFTPHGQLNYIEILKRRTRNGKRIK